MPVKQPPVIQTSPVSRQRLKITGCVQGVGFRPFVYKLATGMGLAGRVGNDDQGVTIDVAGTATQLHIFQQRLRREKPPRASIEKIWTEAPDPNWRASDFKILPSQSKPASKPGHAPGPHTDIPADLRICDHCLVELFAPHNRRYRYPFINCTQCGPRYSLIQRMPYDRCHTSMSRFAMCADCAAEYHSPADRRFHAQPNACPHCGPRLSLLDASGRARACTNPLEDTVDECVRQILEGKIAAVKGVGGFHLVCDARNADAVARLRQRKNRPHKPFAVMACNAVSLEPYVALTAKDKSLLEDAGAPIVLLPKASACDAKLPGVAPGVADLGAILPYTPLHYLLFFSALGYTAKTRRHWLREPHPLMLVMTSANLSGEPLIHTNRAAVEKLGNIADFFLLHDRDIVSRCDDTVLQGGAAPAFIRRARGWAPKSVQLPGSGPSVLACGAFLKNTFCLTKDDKAYLSPHIGDLDSVDTCIAYRETLARLMRQLDIRPQIVACDLHPDFYSTRFAEEYSADKALPLLRIQHHRAHLAAVVAERGLDGPAIGLALDGVGLGEDREAWGGELFYGDACDFNRIGHLSKLPLPGGDKAVREIWRIGAGLLQQSGLAAEAVARFGEREKKNCSTLTSSAGRWFDAIAAILNICRQATFEAQGALQLEACVTGALPEPKGAGRVQADGNLDLRPLLPLIVAAQSPAQAAALFHTELIDGLCRWVEEAAARRGARNLVCAGGCFLNKILRDQLSARLRHTGFKVLLPRRVPCNDGGISLGQAWIAMSR